MDQLLIGGADWIMNQPGEMQPMEIRYSKAAVKTINSMDKATKQRIRHAVERLPKGDVKPLSGSVHLYRLRVGDWRVVFYYPDSDTVLIEKIAPRGGAYKGGLL